MAPCPGARWVGRGGKDPSGDQVWQSGCLETLIQLSSCLHDQLRTAAVTHQAMGEFFLMCARKGFALEAHRGIHGTSPQRLVDPEYIGYNECKH